MVVVVGVISPTRPCQRHERLIVMSHLLESVNRVKDRARYSFSSVGLNCVLKFIILSRNFIRPIFCVDHPIDFAVACLSYNTRGTRNSENDRTAQTGDVVTFESVVFIPISEKKRPRSGTWKFSCLVSPSNR